MAGHTPIDHLVRDLPLLRSGSALWAVRAIVGVLQDGLSIDQVAKVIELPPSTVTRWIDAVVDTRLPDSELLAFIRAAVFAAMRTDMKGIASSKIRDGIKEAMMSTTTYYRWKTQDQNESGSSIRVSNPAIATWSKRTRQPRGIGIYHARKAVLDVVVISSNNQLLVVSRDRGTGKVIAVLPLPAPDATMTFLLDFASLTGGYRFEKITSPLPTQGLYLTREIASRLCIPGLVGKAWSVLPASCQRTGRSSTSGRSLRIMLTLSPVDPTLDQVKDWETDRAAELVEIIAVHNGYEQRTTKGELKSPDAVWDRVDRELAERTRQRQQQARSRIHFKKVMAKLRAPPVRARRGRKP